MVSEVQPINPERIEKRSRVATASLFSQTIGFLFGMSDANFLQEPMMVHEESSSEYPHPLTEENQSDFAQRDIQVTGWSSFKMRRVALRAIGAMYMLAGTAAFAAIPLIGLPLFSDVGIGLGVLGTTLLIAAYIPMSLAGTIVDYTDEEELSALRKQMNTEPLEAVVAAHSWEAIFKYGILFPETVYEKFCEMAENNSVSKHVALYEEGMKAYEEVSSKNENKYFYILPHPSLWKANFRQEVANCGMKRFFNEYSLEMLEKYNLLPQETIDELKILKQRYRKEVNNYREREQDVFASYGEQIDRIRLESTNEMNRLQSDYDTNAAVVRLKNLDVEFEQTLALLLYGIHSRIESAQTRFTSFRNGLLHGRSEEALDNHERELLQTRQEEYEATYAEALREVEAMRERTYAEKERVRFTLQREVDALYMTKRTSISRLIEMTDRRIAECEQTRNLEVENISGPYRERIAALNDRFLSLIGETRVNE